MTHYLDLLRGAVQATEFHSAKSFSWFGSRSPRLFPSVAALLTPEALREQVAYLLTSQLYRDFYCRGLASPPIEDDDGRPKLRPVDFVRALSAANYGAGFWEEGWEVLSVENGTVLVARDALRLRARPAECGLAAGAVLQAGEVVSLHFGKDCTTRSPGYYLAQGDLAFDPEGHGLLRMYWNVTAEGAPRLMRLLTGMFNRAGVPFNFKVVDDPSRYRRCDAAVLYVRASDSGSALELAAQAHAAIHPFLKSMTPAMTLELAVGLGLAEGPSSGESFGWSRCRLVADGLLTARDQGIRSSDGRLQVIVRTFAAAGVSVDHPYLEPGSSARYELPRTRPPVVGSRQPETKPPMNADDFASVASTIGRRLCEEAIWYRNACVWLGPEPRGGNPVEAGEVLRYRTIGPSLYSGTAGVGLFLAELAVVTGDDPFRHAALGAMRHALVGAPKITAAHSLALYSGQLGVAVAAARVGSILGESELLEAAEEICRDCVDSSLPAGREADLLLGDAGAILALLILHRLLERDDLIDLAVQLAGALLRSAEPVGGGLGWPSRAFQDQPPLTGFSHGSSGIGHAFLELFRATSDPSYREAATLAFAHERSLFDAGAGNWPDLRKASRRRPARLPSFMVAWCHGAPGIALARLCAYQELGDSGSKEEALLALSTTASWVRSAIHHAAPDFSLCHGIAGNAEVLVHGRRILGDEAPGADLPEAVALHGVHSYALSQGRIWPCGGGSGESPDLMLGLAGIGHYYLRLANPATPSVLLPRPEEFSVAAAPSPAEVRVPSRSHGGVDDRFAVYQGGMTDDHVRAVVHLALAGQHFSPSETDAAAVRRDRWALGCRLRDEALPRAFPPFAELVDYLSLPEDDPYLWKSLPYMLAFGYEQADAMAPLIGLPRSEEASVAAAIFSALLSVFDYLVDETSSGADVFAIEREVLPHMVNGSANPTPLLARAYSEAHDPRIRLLCVMFELLQVHLTRSLPATSDTGGDDLPDVLSRLFAAERTVTLAEPRSLEEMRSLLKASEDKSVLPFVTLLGIVSRGSGDGQVSDLARRATTSLGRAVSLADDLVDLATDARRAFPTALVVDLAERAARRGSAMASDADVYDVIETSVPRLLARLDPAGFEARDSDEPGQVAALRRFTVDTVARWVGWNGTEAAPGARGRPLSPEAAMGTTLLIRQGRAKVGLTRHECCFVLDALLDARAAGHRPRSGACERLAIRLLRVKSSLTSDELGMVFRALWRIGGVDLASGVDEQVAAKLTVATERLGAKPPAAQNGDGPEVVATLLSAILEVDAWKYHSSVMRFACELETQEAGRGQWTSSRYRDAAYPTYRSASVLAQALPDSSSLERARSRILAHQHDDGSWGDGRGVPESTALAVLTLEQIGSGSADDDAILAGIRFLGRVQEADGGWPAVPFLAGGTAAPARASRAISTSLCVRAFVAAADRLRRGPVRPVAERC